MNDALQKFLQIAAASFWDRQLYVFLIFSVVSVAMFVLVGKKSLKFDPFSGFAAKFFGKSEASNYVLIVGVNLFLWAALVSVAGVPVPQTHDEFAYLLAADTFSHGRIVNPAPASPRHFEYFHILTEPVYAAKYPPLQGFFLATGKILTGFPIAGVWLSGLLASFAVYWLLRGFFAARWSLYGTLLWICAPLNLVWLDSYWGGHAAVIGGALSAGAVFRLSNNGGRKYFIFWGVGIFLLVNSRPFEGAVLTAVLFFVWVYDALKRRKFGGRFRGDLAIFAVLIGINLAWTGFYNYMVTSDPSALPYRLHHARYHRVPLFVFEKIGEPKPDVPPIVGKLDERWTAEFQDAYRSPSAAVKSTLERIPAYLLWLTRSPFLLILLCLGLSGAARGAENVRAAKSVFIFGAFLAALTLTVFKGDRFIAPVVGVAFMAVTLGAKMLARKNEFLKALVPALPLIVGGAYLSGDSAIERRRVETPRAENQFLSRSEIVDFLTARGGKHLIFVETGAAHPADARFYVYNEAEIKDAAIVWAHDLSPPENDFLTGEFGGRRIWLLETVDNRAVLREYERK
ncbi:MAG TPA: hypothetical protein VIL74_09770 [Pyrinomonadaceae bacterium]|jgi:hypothetical protein